MSTVLDEPRLHQSTAPAQRLRTTMAAVRVSFHGLGTQDFDRRTTGAEAAEPFGADARFLSARARSCWTPRTRPTRRSPPSAAR